MDRNVSSSSLREDIASSIPNISRKLREDAERHAKVLDLVAAYLQQAESPTPAWTPPLNIQSVIAYKPYPKVRHVETPRTNSRDILARIKATRPGKLYANHLRQNPFVRGITIWVWRNLYLVYVSRISIHFQKRYEKRWRHLTKLSQFVKLKELQTIQVLDGALANTPAPKVFPVYDQGYLSPPQLQYVFPKIYVATINDGIIYGGTNLVLTENAVICHDLYDFERDYTSEELHGRTLIDPRKGRIRWLLHDEMPARLPVAAVFVDACGANYAHWLTEVLPRIASFCSEEKFKDIPIVINDGLHKNIMDSLFIIAGLEREIIKLPIGRALQVGALYLTSVAGYVPFDQRNENLPDHSHGLFNPKAFGLIRQRIASFVDNLHAKNIPEKIYLRRNSGARKITNSTEVEEIMVAEGYVIVEPENLTFLQQVMLFSQAKSIVSPTGAAVANVIFANQGTNLCILMAKHEKMIYRYWLNMLAPLNINISYVLGDVVKGSGHGIHADYYVNINNILELIKSS